MGIKVTNNAYGVLAAGITASDTTLSVGAGEGARFPSLAGGDYFYLTLVDTANNIEIVKVTARSTNTMTIVRAQDGTTAKVYPINSRAELRPCAAMFAALLAEAGIQSVTAGKVLGRDTSGAGAVQELPISVDANGNVGIGNSSMSSFNSAYNNLVVGTGSGNEGLTIYAGSANSAYIGLKSAANTSFQGGWEYDFATNTLYTYTNGIFRTSISGAGVITYFNTPSSSLSGANFRVAGNQCYMNWSHGPQTTTAEYIYWINGNGIVGSISSNGSSTSYNTSSDYRLKDNVAAMTGALAKVALLKPVTYTWKVDGSAGEGFIAHELQEVVPNCVTGEKDAVNEDGTIKAQSIDTSFLVATLTAAIQEQQALIENLTTRLSALENK